MLSVLFMLDYGKALAETAQDSSTEEFFNAAMELDANLPPADAAKAEAVSKAAEQSMAAEQVGENAMNSGNHVLHSVKAALMGIVDKIHSVGSALTSKLSALLGTNPMVTKIIVGLVLVFVSVIVITVLVLIAKKIMFKKKTNQVSDNLDEYEEVDEDDEYDDDNVVYDDTDDENERLQQEFDDFDEDFEDEQDTVTVTQNSSDNIPQIQIAPVSNAEEIAKHISPVLQTPQTKEGALKNFIKITQGV